MTRDIVVQGEHYKDVESLQAMIAVLDNDLANMPSESPERNALAAHIDKLKAAASSAADDGAVVPIASTAVVPAEEAPEEEEEEEEEPTVDLRVAAETGASLFCPLCGQEVDFPEVPPIDQTVERCPNCDGWGKVVRPSRVDGHIWKECPQCQGEGVIDKPGAPVSTPVQTYAPVPEAPGALFDSENQRWNPPSGVQPPWAGATWDSFYGKWA